MSDKHTYHAPSMGAGDYILLIVGLASILYGLFTFIETKMPVEESTWPFRYFVVDDHGVERMGFINDGGQYVFCDGYSAEAFKEDVVMLESETACF